MNRKKIFCLLGLTCVSIAGIASVNEINTFASDETQKMFFKKATSLVTNNGQIVADKMPSDSEVYIIDEKFTDPAITNHYNGKKDSKGKRPRQTYFVKETYIGRVTLFSPIISNKSDSIYRNINTHISGPASLYENINYNGGLSQNKKSYRVAENTGCNGTIDGTTGGKPRHYGFHSTTWHVQGATWKEGKSKYEYRYLGYSDKGAVIANPFFPSDSPLGSKISPIGDHPFAENPWNVVGNTPSGRDVIVKKSYYDNPNRADLVKQKNDVFKALKIMHITMADKSDAYWSKRMSLRNNPKSETPVLTGGRLVNGTVWYRSATVVEDDRTGERNEKNLAIDKLVVKDASGTEVGKYTRTKNNPMVGKATASLIKGQKYKVEITIADKGPSFVSGKGTVDNGVMPGASSRPDTNIRGAKINNEKTTRKTMKDSKSQVVSYDFTVPMDNQKKYTVQSRISTKHTFNGDNTIYNDDNALIQFDIKDGDLVANKVHLWNETKKRYEDSSKSPNKDLPAENTIVPGDKYQVGFEGEYKGETVYGSNGVPVTKEFVVHTYVKRFAKNGESQVEKEDVKVKVKLEKGAKFTAWTSAKIYECPKLESEAVISTQPQKEGYNLKTDNDSWGKNYSSPYDISIKNAILLPQTEMINGKQKIKIAVKYDAYLDVPRGDSDYQIDTKTLIKVGNTNKTVTDHLKKGWNRNIIHEIVVDAVPGQQIPGSIFINGDKGSWEDDKFINPAQTNNKANSDSFTSIGGKNDMKVIVNPPKNPYNGACALNGVRTSKTWNQMYSVMSWSAKKTNYTINNKTQQNYDFTITSNQDISRNQFEKYKIDSILFKSKMTEDLKMGSSKDGWVDLKKEKGKIKAGYGYELKVKTSYRTNAFETQPKDSIDVYAGTGTWVRPKHVAPNLPNDLYVKTPDGKILSVSGVHGTTKGLKFSSSGNVVKNGSQTWTYEIKPSNSLGFKEAGKLFVSEETPDGDYSLQVFTPDVNGIATTPGYGQDYLCDSNKVTITVDGAMTDDLNDHLTQ